MPNGGADVGRADRPWIDGAGVGGRASGGNGVSSTGFDGHMELPVSRLLGEGGASMHGLVLDGRDQADLAVEPPDEPVDVRVGRDCAGGDVGRNAAGSPARSTSAGPGQGLARCPHRLAACPPRRARSGRLRRGQRRRPNGPRGGAAGVISARVVTCLVVSRRHRHCALPTRSRYATSGSNPLRGRQSRCQRRSNEVDDRAELCNDPPDIAGILVETVPAGDAICGDEPEHRSPGQQ